MYHEQERIARGVVDTGFAKPGASSSTAGQQAHVGMEGGEDDVASGVGELVSDSGVGGAQPEVSPTADTPEVHEEELPAATEAEPVEEVQCMVYCSVIWTVCIG